MIKNLFISLVTFMIFSILGIVILQGYWIFSAWNDKEKEFSLAVQQSLMMVADEIQERELSDYIAAYEKLLDSIETPDDASFANVFLFLDEDKTNNLMSYYAYGILEEDYKITPYLDPVLGDTIETLTNICALKILKKKSKNIIVITEKKQNQLYSLVKKMDLFHIEHRKYIGGRYSILSEVGMIPAYLMGLNINNFRKNLLKHFKDKNKNYLKDRKQRVVINNEYSDYLPVLSGVPQGSIIGPILLSLIHISEPTRPERRGLAGLRV